MLGHLIYSYDHLDDARIQQEISRGLYAPLFGGVKIIHAHNGKASFGYKKYLEDILIKRKNLGHFDGAADLIDSGIRRFMGSRTKGLRYVLVTAADTWCLDATWLKSIVDEMQGRGKVVACSSWGHSKPSDKPSGFSTDFFILDLEWARKAKIFPLNFPEFRRKYADIFLLQWSMPTVEACFQTKFASYYFNNFKDNENWMNRNAAWRRIAEREPVHVSGDRISDWPEIGLYTNPEPKTKKVALAKLRIPLGRYSDKLLTSKDISYYNGLG